METFLIKQPKENISKIERIENTTLKYQRQTPYLDAGRPPWYKFS